MSRVAPSVDLPTAPANTTPHTPDSTARLRQWMMIGFTVITAAFIVIYFIQALDWRSHPFLGVTLDHTMTINAARPNSESAWNGREAGLRGGDRLQSIAGEPVTGPQAEHYMDVLTDLEPGQTVMVTFNRPVAAGMDEAPIYGMETCAAPVDGVASCEVPVELGQMPGSDTIAFFLLPVISSVFVLVLASVIIRLRPYQPVSVLTASACLTLAIYMAGIFDVGTSHSLVPVWLMASGLMFGLMLTIGLTFPLPVGVIYRMPVLRYVPVAVGAVVGLALIGLYLSETQENLHIATQIAGVFVLAGNIILASLLFFYQRPRAVDSVTRDQANTIFIGMLLALAPALVWLVGLVSRLLTNREVLAFSVEASMPFLIMPAVGLTYATLRIRHFDTDRFISRAITFSIMLAALIMGYFFLVLGASLFTTSAVDASDPLLIALTVFLMATLFLPVRNHLQRRIERIYFRERQNYSDRLEGFSQRLTTFSDVGETIDAFETILNETIQPEALFIYLRDPETESYVVANREQGATHIEFTVDSGVVELIQNRRVMIYLDPRIAWPIELRVDRARLQILQTLVIAGLGGQDVNGQYLPNGFALIGPPRSGSGAYKFEELRFIDTLISQVAIAVERAQVIGNLERRVQELDVLSQVGQAVNFTVEYEDLLELINAQTYKVLGAEYFYIALHDTNANQFYYAFFQEGADRARDKENKRWPAGSGLFTEIIETAQPVRLEDYAETLHRKGYRHGLESHDTKAWMGVPLIAGQNTLGVLAVGDPSPERVFTADELRIFSNLAALAATSLDKARLFLETNVRARQLSALNDISRRLVAAEADIEALLDLITGAAVDILNAEAGSLLLTAEDGSGDLEFQAAVGGTGDELIGKRLEAGYGLVGKVAQTGEAIISNDISQDQRWDGEVAGEGQFRTSSILAVPLIAQNTTIGVLEVLNKKDGTVYTEEDQNLLTAFAGQAAIALENARLFQRTDEQLARRLEELEALERIDVELNRTLDLNRIAELTVNWAVDNSSATAGMLGVVNTEAGELSIACTVGYPPEATEGDTWWLLDRGIIKRVMRTRSLDLQPDVSIDPERDKGLPDALSQLTIPMMSGNEIIAILVLETDREPRLGLLDVERLQRMADHAAIAIANALFSNDLLRANETKSEFMGFAAHELKNPLTSVKGYAATMQNPKMLEMAGPDQIQNIAGIIQSNAQRMQNIIDDLRDIAAIDAGPAKFKIDLEPTALRGIVTDTLMSFQSQFEEREQTVDNRVGDDLPLIMADSKRLIQVMTNFVSNAHKYGGYGTTITIDASVIERYRNQRGKVVGDVMHISISDQGIGMSEEDLKRLFREDYFRSENEKAREQKGTGLGMMITKRIVERHGGEVWVESELEVGSTFNFVIPLAQSKTATGENQRITAENPAVTGENNTVTQETESAPGSD